MDLELQLHRERTADAAGMVRQDAAHLRELVFWVKISLCPVRGKMTLTPIETKNSTSKKALKIIKHDNSGLSLIRGRLWCTGSFKGSSCICYERSVTVAQARYSAPPPLIFPSSKCSPLCKALALRLQNKRNPLTLFVLPLLGDMSLPGGMKMEKILSFLPCILCWLLGAKPMPQPGGPAYPLRGLGSLLLQEQYPSRSQQPLSSKDVVVGPRMPAMWKEKKGSEEGLETE